MPDEEAFCVLVKMMKFYNLRGHFLPGMEGLQLRLFQFDHLVEEMLPKLHHHLRYQGINSSMYASQWFMTLFAYKFPLSLVFRIYDTIFMEGIESIFRFSIALLKKNEKKLIEMDFEPLLEYLKSGLFESYQVYMRRTFHFLNLIITIIIIRHLGHSHRCSCTICYRYSIQDK